MKQKLFRLVALFLCILVALPAGALTAFAAGELTNLYDVSTSVTDAVPNSNDINANITLSGYFGSAAIEVAPGDLLYFGPCDTTHQWHLACYTDTSGRIVERTNYTVVDTFSDGSVIYSYTVPANVTRIRLAGKLRFRDVTLLTVNQRFDTTSYAEYFKGQGSQSGLTPPTMADVTDASVLVNLYPRVGDCNETIHQNTNVDTYKTSDHIAVASGDVITIGALRQASSGEAVLFYDSSKKLVASLNSASLPLHEDIGRGYGIYWVTVLAGATTMQVKVHLGVYNDGDVLVTKNQPFTGDLFRAFLGIDYYLAGADEHPFFGKTALFIGDNISYGSFDTPPSYRNPSASWARRLALSTGLEVTNASIGGAAMRECSRTWIYNQYASQTNKDFDLIVMQGGVNDARDSADYGSILPIASTEAALKANTASFAGGLQWLFYNVRKDSPDAELYYIANFKLTDPTGRAQDMSGYFALAAELCELYGVHFIDLYGDEELYKKFNPAAGYLPDKLHPIKYGYDLLFPTILRLFNETVKTDEPVTPPATGETTAETTAPAPTETEPVADATTAETQVPPKGGEPAGGCQSSAGILGAVMLFATAAIFLAKRKKEK